MFHTVLARWRATGAMLRQSEKMAQLGTLTAGVAHELNNPAAAVQRGASQLADALDDLLAAERALAQPLATPSFASTIARCATSVRARAARLSDLDAVTRGDREEEVEAWLDARAVPDAGGLAPTLVTLGYDVGEAGSAGRRRRRRHLPAVARWLARPTWCWNRLAEVAQGAGRISEIVKALKGYAYLDQAPVQEVDVHEGIDSTLVILRHKLKAGINVRARVRARSAAHLGLGQRAQSGLDEHPRQRGRRARRPAKDGSAEITIRTRREGDFVVVEIRDNGPGIPAEIQDRIFDAFFTTKPPGKGTGLGLDISYRIVVHRHRGDLRVSSRPGDTTFTRQAADQRGRRSAPRRRR